MKAEKGDRKRKLVAKAHISKDDSTPRSGARSPRRTATSPVREGEGERERERDVPKISRQKVSDNAVGVKGVLYLLAQRYFHSIIQLAL